MRLQPHDLRKFAEGARVDWFFADLDSTPFAQGAARSADECDDAAPCATDTPQLRREYVRARSLLSAT